jgi:putative ABC transport system permease protein
MDALLQDLRYGCRALVANPGFAIITVLTLALGIGANTAIFSMIDAVLVRPLPYDKPEQLVVVWEDASFAGFPRNTPAPANYADWKAQNQVFAGMAAMQSRTFSLTGSGEPEKVSASAVTADLFPLLGVAPALGRAFSPEEDAPGAGKVAVISYGLWQRRYGADRGVLGTDVLLNDEKYTVVGVAPPGFQFLESDVDVWVPMAFDAEELANRGGHYLTVVARLKDGVTLERAQADVETIMARIARDYPDDAARLGALVRPLREELAGDLRLPLAVLLVAVAFVLLIACANVANLLLSRAVGRRREIAVRAALGATRLRMVRQLLTESVLLSGAGALLGLALAYGSFAFLRQLIPAPMNLSTSLSIDGRVFGFTLLLALATGIGFGLAPAVMASKADLNEALKQGGGRAGFGAGGKRLRSVLVATQVGLALVLLIGASLLIQTLFRLRGQYSDLRAESVLTMQTVLSPGRYDTHDKRAAFYDAVLDRVRATPGVLAAGYTTSVPLEWKGGTSGFVVEGHTFETSLSYDANHRQVTADYLKAIGIPVRRGRHFTEADAAGALPVAIVNETMAREYWPGEDALGRRFKMGGPDDDTPWITVVGIAADVRQMGVDEPVKAEMYVPYAQTTSQQWFAPRDLVIRTTGDPTSLTSAVRNEIREVDPNQPVSNVRTMDEVLGEETSSRRVGMVLLTAFAMLALLLASVGIYGLLSYTVVQHTPEIGVRLALGARPRDILVMILRRGMALALAGTAVGLVSALALARLISSLLFGVASADPATFAGVPALLLAVALVACYVPARRAARVDPNVALKYE